MEVLSTSSKQTQKIAQDLTKTLHGGEVIALFGGLGAGKTIFVQGLARGLGIKRRITSPTFIMVRPYDIKINNKPLTFYHVDLYRCQHRDLKSLGIEEIFRPDSIVVIEWAEKIKEFLPKKRIDVKIDIENESRKITITHPSLSSPPSHLSSPPSHLSSPPPLSFPRKRESVNFKKAAQVLKKGGIVVFPTDTVYGIGCRWDFPKSVARIYQIKGTPKTQPFPALVSSIDQVKNLAEINKTARQLMAKFWPGAMTIILPSRRPETNVIASRAKQSIQKVGFRMPDSDLVQNLIEKVCVPIVGTSANLHGKPAVKTSNDLDPRLTKQVDYVLEGECEGGVESTVVDATEDPPKVLRQGAINLS